MTTRDEIRTWAERGLDKKATHMIVVCDTYDHEDYPSFVFEGESARTAADKCNGESMQRVMEVYDLRMSLDEQLSEHRAFHY